MADVTLISRATLTGMYDGTLTALDSTVVTTRAVDGLTIVQSADKEVWSGGELSYTITITNTAEHALATPVITNILEPGIVTLIEGSVTVDGIVSTNYTYDEPTGLLTINLSSVGINDIAVVAFKVGRK